MPDLSFQVEGAEAVPFAVAPLLVFKLRVTNARAEESLHSIVLRCQIQIEATRRRYNGSGTRAQLLDWFGEPDRWSQTVAARLDAHDGVVPPFTRHTVVDFPSRVRLTSMLARPSIFMR